MFPPQAVRCLPYLSWTRAGALLSVKFNDPLAETVMIYDDGTGRRIYRPLRGRRPPPEGTPEVSEADREAIRRVVADHPRWGPKQVYAELRVTRHDIPFAAVERVMAGRQRERPSRGRSRW
jgi:hypothetical protein